MIDAKTAVDAETARRQLLPSILSNVVFDGWTNHALRNAASAAGYDRADVGRLFPGGVPEVVDLFADWADGEMEASLGQQDLTLLAVRDRIALAVRCRFQAIAPYREAVRNSLAFLSLPPNLGLGGRLVARTVDRIWYAAGDVSTDFNWYTKRATLAAILGVTTLYWLEDRSEESAETWGFLDRRIAGVMRSGNAASNLTQVSNVFSFFPSPRRFIRQLRRQADGP